MSREKKASPEPFFLKGGRVGVLLLHGFTGSPAEMAPVARSLHKKGFTVSAPLLPGHGTTPEDLNRRRWGEWVSHAQSALRELSAECDAVFVGGLSLGSLIALQLALLDRSIRGVVLYSPPLILRSPPRLSFHLAKRFVRVVPKARYQEADLRDPRASARLCSYDRIPLIALGQTMRLAKKVRANLIRVTCPALVVYSVHDKTIHETSAQITFDGLGSAKKRIVMLRDSGHALTVDGEWKDVAEQTARFIQEQVRTTGRAARPQNRTVRRAAGGTA
jgi:carboxylesterase